MKGVSYLTNDAGEKTHVVLDLKIWHRLWQELHQEYETHPSLRRPEVLRELLQQANMPIPKHVGDSLIELEETQLLDASTTNLKQELLALEADIPKADVDKWLAAFHS